MSAFVSGIYRIILGTFPVIDLPRSHGGLSLSTRQGIITDLRLSSPSADILDFGAGSGEPVPSRQPLKNHFPPGARARLCGDSGRPMLLGHIDNSLLLRRKDSDLQKPEIAGGLY